MSAIKGASNILRENMNKMGSYTWKIKLYEMGTDSVSHMLQMFSSYGLPILQSAKACQK